MEPWVWPVIIVMVVGAAAVHIAGMKESRLQYQLFAVMEFSIAAYNVYTAVISASQKRMLPTATWLLIASFMVLMAIGSLQKAKELK